MISEDIWANADKSTTARQEPGAFQGGEQLPHLMVRQLDHAGESLQQVIVLGNNRPDRRNDLEDPAGSDQQWRPSVLQDVEAARLKSVARALLRPSSPEMEGLAPADRFPRAAGQREA